MLLGKVTRESFGGMDGRVGLIIMAAIARSLKLVCIGQLGGIGAPLWVVLVFSNQGFEFSLTKSELVCFSTRIAQKAVIVQFFRELVVGNDKFHDMGNLWMDHKNTPSSLFQNPVGGNVKPVFAVPLCSVVLGA